MTVKTHWTNETISQKVGNETPAAPMDKAVQSQREQRDQWKDPATAKGKHAQHEPRDPATIGSNVVQSIHPIVERECVSKDSKQ